MPVCCSLSGDRSVCLSVWQHVPSPWEPKLGCPRKGPPCWEEEWLRVDLRRLFPHAPGVCLVFVLSINNTTSQSLLSQQ